MADTPNTVGAAINYAGADQVFKDGHTKTPMSAVSDSDYDKANPIPKAQNSDYEASNAATMKAQEDKEEADARASGSLR